MLDKIKELVSNRKIEWKKHALKRIFERNLSRSQIFEALFNCEIIEHHELQRPLPSVLVLGYYGEEPLHMMLAVDEIDEILWIITVYKPSLEEWMDDYKTRRKK
ncbi:MAG: DUF4258 domain-containing protein [Candidatus Aquicultor sp.]|nr:DUF4258 domain-containing protein [Candidatus Aquicultor sp.]